MGYACPVCGVEQADAEHLANHLAVTASLGREDHEEWLEEHVPTWGEMGPTELGERLAELAPTVDTPESVTEPGPVAVDDPVQGRPPGLEDALARQSRQPGRGALSAEAQRAIDEARELTRRMYDSGPDDGSEPAASTEGSGADATGDGNENA